MSAADWRRAILSMSSSPIAQRYAFAHYVLNEPRRDAAAIAGALQAKPMDEREYDVLAERWKRD